jgi:hypothetical protein
MLPISNRESGATPARPTDEFVPEASRTPRVTLHVLGLLAGAVVAPVAVALIPVADPARRLVYLGVLVVVWSFIVRAVVRRPSPRRWTGIAIGTGFAILGESARTLFVSSGQIALLHGADVLRITAYVILAFSFGVIVRHENSENGRASVLDGAIVGCALFATCWPMLAYPSAMSRAAEASGGIVGAARPLLAIVVCACGVRLLFRHEVASRLLFFGVLPLAGADLLDGAGIIHSTGTGRSLLEISTLFGLSVIAIAARRATTAEAQLVDIDPANRLRLLCILTSVALCSTIPLADAWTATVAGATSR